MSRLFVLLRPKFLGFRNRMTRSQKGARLRILFLACVGTGFWVGLFLLCCRVLGYFQSVEVIGNDLARYLLDMVVLTLFSLLIFSNIVTALSNLYISKDLELCQSTPVVVEELFGSRALMTLLDSSWMLVIFGAPVYLAYGRVYGAGPGFYVGVFHLNLAMVVIAGALGLLITMTLVRLFPARGTKDTIMLLSLVLAASLYLLLRFLRPERLVNPEAFFSLVQYVDALRVADSAYLPTHWITEILWRSLGQGGIQGRAFLTALVWMTAGALGVICIWTARAIYDAGFSKAQEAKGRRRGAKKVLDVLVGALTRPMGRDLGAIVAKDLRIFFRDNTQWSQLLLLGAIVVVYLYNFSVLPLDKTPIRLDFLQNELGFLNLGLAGFVLTAVSARFVFPAVSGEGEAYWIVQSSPMNCRRFLRGKFLFFLVPMLLLGEGLIVLTNTLLEVTPFMMGLSSVTMVLLVFGIVSLGVGLGAYHPDFKHENIAQVSTGVGGILYMIIAAAFVGLVILLEAGPVYLLFMDFIKAREIGWLGWTYIGSSFVAVLFVSAFTTYKPMDLGLRTLEQHE